MRLLPHQADAVRFVRERAAGARTALSDGEVRADRLTRLDRAEFDRLTRIITAGYPVDVHFHPDRVSANGLTVIDALAASRTYENQFVTKISNGALDTATSGKRGRWETRLYGGAYDGHPDADRPKYGALNLFDTHDGACPRFGSCYFRLHAQTSDRCTVSYGDSHIEPDAVGTPDAPERLLAALLRDFSDATARAETDVSIARISRRLRAYPTRAGGASQGRILDDYIEVQLHGALSLASDVRYLSADAAFRGTTEGATMTRLADACGIELRWRPALVLSIGSVPASFRGEALTSFVDSIRVAGRIDAARLGRVARSVVSDPASWSTWGTPPAVLQLVKQTWHAMVAFGELDDAVLGERWQ